MSIAPMTSSKLALKTHNSLLNFGEFDRFRSSNRLAIFFNFPGLSYSHTALIILYSLFTPFELFWSFVNEVFRVYLHSFSVSLDKCKELCVSVILIKVGC